MKMKDIKYFNVKNLSLMLVLTVLVSCERELSDMAEFATFSKTGEIFTDNFVGLGTNFFFPFVSDGAKADVFSVDEDVAYESSASIRIDVPNADDPDGSFAGAIFIIDGSGRNLTEFDALTFWAKSTQGVSDITMGFGESKFQVARNDISFSTSWVKYIIPIPDASKLTSEKGMLFFSAGSQNTGGFGYTFWLDEIKFEKLGTIAQAQPAIFGGATLSQEAFLDIPIQISGLSQTFNTPSGNITVSATPFYFDFESSDINVAFPNEAGLVSVINTGQATITATLADVAAAGSLALDVTGAFNFAPTPPERDDGDVISIFSNAYTNVNDLNFAVFNDQNVQIAIQDANDDQIVRYENLGFVGLGWDGTEDVSGMTHLHVDVQLINSTNPALIVELIDFGANNADGGGDDTGGGFTVPSSQLIEGSWAGIDIPIDAFTQGTGGGFLGSPNLNNIARVVFVSNGSSFIIDNIYFYKE